MKQTFRISIFILFLCCSYRCGAIDLGCDEGDLSTGAPICPLMLDLSSDSVWDRYAVCICSVESIVDGDSEAILNLKTVRSFCGSDCPEKMRASCHNFWFDFDDTDRSVNDGDKLLLMFLREVNHPYLAAIKLPDAFADSALIRRLVKIQGFRDGEGGLRSLSEGVFDDDPVVSLYCLKRMMTRFPPDVHGYIERLRRLRDTPASVKEVQELCDPATMVRRRDEIFLKTKARILAAQLMLAMQSATRDPDTQYHWLYRTFTDSKNEVGYQLDCFVNALLEFKDRSTETSEFLASLAANHSIREEIRLAAARGLERAKPLTCTPNIDIAQTVLCTGVLMLLDPDAKVRSAGLRCIASSARKAAEGDESTKSLVFSVDRTILWIARHIEPDEQLRDQVVACERELERNWSGGN